MTKDKTVYLYQCKLVTAVWYSVL